MGKEDIREGDPDKVRKKKPAPPPDDDEEDERPRKKRDDDENEDTEDEEKPRKKKRPRNDEDDDDANDLGNSPLSAVVPVGGSIWAVLSFWIALLSCIVPLPLLGLLAVGLGILAFLTHKSKASYGSITGNMRAVLGIVIGLVTMIGSSALLFFYFTKGFN